jgi:hypothetical protein
MAYEILYARKVVRDKIKEVTFSQLLPRVKHILEISSSGLNKVQSNSADSGHH